MESGSGERQTDADNVFYRIGVKAFVEKVSFSSLQNIVHVTSRRGILNEADHQPSQNGEPRKAEILSIKQRNGALTF